MNRSGANLGMPRGSMRGLFAIVLALVMNLAFSELNIRRLVDNEDRVIDVHAELTLLQELLAAIREAESAERGFLITGTPDYLKSYESAVARTNDAVGRLERRAGGVPERQSRLATLRRAIDSRLSELRSAIAARQSRDFEAAQECVAANHGRRLMGEIRRLVAAMRQSEEAILAQRAADSQRSIHLAVATDVVGAVIGVGLVGLAFALFRRDFLHQRRADEASRRLAAIVESSDDAIIGETVDGIVTSWNAGAAEVFGFRADEMLGKSAARLIPPGLVDQGSENIECAARGLHVDHYETKRVTKDGRAIDVSLNVSPIKDPAGKVVGIASIARDVTEQKTLQRAVLEIASQEQRRIGQDLHDGAGQELTGLAMLSQRLTAILEERSVPEVGMAAKITDGLEEVLRAVRILSRGLVPVQLDSEGLMAALADLAARTSEMHDVICTFQCDEPVCIPNNDVATNLYRMSQEAVTNAIKHGSAKNIVISLAVDGDRVTLKVADDGTGLKQSQEPTTAGAGLRIMRYRAQLIGAELAVVSNGCQGTEVRCCFVCKRAPDGSCEPAVFVCAQSNCRATCAAGEVA